MSRNRRAIPGPPRQPDPTRIKHKQRWKNVGTRVVHGLKPHQVGELDLTEGEAKALIQAGHLVPAAGHGHPAEGNGQSPNNGRPAEGNGPPADKKKDEEV